MRLIMLQYSDSCALLPVLIRRCRTFPHQLKPELTQHLMAWNKFPLHTTLYYLKTQQVKSFR